MDVSGLNERLRALRRVIGIGAFIVFLVISFGIQSPDTFPSAVGLLASALMAF